VFYTFQHQALDRAINFFSSQRLRY